MRLSKASVSRAATEIKKSGGPRTTDFQERVYAATLRVPKGRVATYQDVARAIGRPHAVRAVGNALNRNPYAAVPCHRVVPKDGRVGGYARGTPAKAACLHREGVEVVGGKISLLRFRITLSK